MTLKDLFTTKDLSIRQGQKASPIPQGKGFLTLLSLVGKSSTGASRLSAPLAATSQLFHPMTPESVEAALYAFSAPLMRIWRRLEVCPMLGSLMMTPTTTRCSVSGKLPFTTCPTLGRSIRAREARTEKSDNVYYVKWIIQRLQGLR